MYIYKINKGKFFLCGFIVMMAYVSFYAKNGIIHYESADRAGATKIKKEAPKPAITGNNSTKRCREIVFPASRHSRLFSFNVRDLNRVASIFHRRHNVPQPIVKIRKENTYRNIYILDLSLYLQEPRLNLCITAIQCGILTSFAALSPPQRLS